LKEHVDEMYKPNSQRCSCVTHVGAQLSNQCVKNREMLTFRAKYIYYEKQFLSYADFAFCTTSVLVLHRMQINFVVQFSEMTKG
jgi:hypothetical protein